MTQFHRLFRAVEPTVLCYPANRSKKEANENKNLFVSRGFERIINTFTIVSRGDQELVLARLRADTPR